MSRRRDTEIMFGSDSFLDVVANIVGILIILIVIAGVRVSNAPVAAPAIVAPTLDAEPAMDLPPAESEEPFVPEPTIVVAPPEGEPEPGSLNDPPPLPDLVPPPELVAKVQKLEAQIASITQECRSLNEALTNENLQQSLLEQRLQTGKDLLTERTDEMNAVKARESEQKRDLELARQAVARLKAQINEEELKATPAEKLEHRITPVSKTVLGRELHFRLDKNRVAEVPIEALIDRLKEHIERRRDWLMKTRQHKGLVGPINGFNMEYVLAIEPMSDLDALRTGYGGFKMSMRKWEIQPEDTLRGETADQALSQGSKFHQALLNSDANTTLTFWVYPDSHQVYRKLQKFAHEHGFPVAARPLPAGIPIAGAPNGTRSASQ